MKSLIALSFFLFLLTVNSFAENQNKTTIDNENVVNKKIRCDDLAFDACNEIEDTIEAYNWDCTGEICASIWDRQYSQVQDTINELRNLKIRSRSETSYKFGLKAFYLASTICGNTRDFSMQRHGDLIFNLILMENTLLRELSNVQRHSPIKIHKFCHIKVR